MKFNEIWMGTPLRLDVNGKLTGEFKPKQKWDKLDNEVKPMLGLSLIYLMVFV